MSVEVKNEVIRDGGFELAVTQEGMNITVKAGTFRVKHEDFELTEDAVFAAVADSTYQTNVVGYLAQDLGDGGAVVLVVDEVLLDGVDAPSRWDSAAYRVLHAAFMARVPAGATTLDAVPVYAMHLTQPVAAEVDDE